MSTQTPFRPSPETIEKARNFIFEPPLDPEIRPIVLALLEGGVETFESCQGGRGHCFAEPTVRFEGDSSEGLRALSVAMANALPVKSLNRTWALRDDVLHGPWWEMKFWPPRGSEQEADRDTDLRYEKERATRESELRMAHA